MDDRLVADEFFRGVVQSAVCVRGELSYKLKYMAMFANSLSGEFGLFGTFGDYDDQIVATLLIDRPHLIQ